MCSYTIFEVSFCRRLVLPFSAIPLDKKEDVALLSGLGLNRKTATPHPAFVFSVLWSCSDEEGLLLPKALVFIGLWEIWRISALVLLCTPETHTLCTCSSTMPCKDRGDLSLVLVTRHVMTVNPAPICRDACRPYQSENGQLCLIKC